MKFYPDDAPVPVGIQTDEFLLRMLRATDVTLDYDAVMSSQEILHQRSDGTWPRDDFTMAENLADLEEHERDFLARAGFTYTIMNLTETVCLGCVYIYPLATLLQRLKADEDDLQQLGDYAAQVSFWVRQSRVADDLDKRVLATLWPWLQRDFTFTHVVMCAASAETRQIAIMEAAGLRLTARYPKQTGEMVLFA